MVTLKQIKKVKTLEQLMELGIGEPRVDIGPRGGGLGFWASDIAKHFEVSEGDLPRCYGAGCNYLGGGVRGAIFPSGYNTKAITGKTAEFLDALAEACVRVYEFCENGMNDEVDENGETNWDAAATKAARRSGTVSAY